MSPSTAEQAIINYFTPDEQVRSASAFFEAWKSIVQLVQPKLFLSNGVSLADSICPRDLTPNMTVITSSFTSLTKYQQYLTCILVSLYDSENGQFLSRLADFDFLRDIVKFGDRERKLITELIKNFTNSAEYWGSFDF